MSEKMPITPEVLVWARNRSGRDLSEVKKKYPKIQEWEEGTDQPSYAALSALSGLYMVPVAVFFMPSPPPEPPLNQKFRTIPEYELDNLSVNLRKILREAQAMQINLYELHDGFNPSKKKIFHDLQLSTKASLSSLTGMVRKYLSIDVEEQSKWADEKTAFEKWRDIFISHGVYVFKDAFKNDAFSGFCLYDEQFPVIYVNNSTTPTRQNFTLFHELAHLLFRTSGIDKEEDSYIEALSGNDKRIEVICNKFSAAFLVPDDDFDKRFKGIRITDQAISLIADRYKVSRAVILLKLLDRKIVSNDYYMEKLEEWNGQSNHKGKGKGGSYYNTEMSYLGKKYITLALSKYHQNKISNIQLADYLNIKPKNVGRYEEIFLGRRA